MTTRELDIDGVRTPLRETGPADASEAVVFVHGNPGSSADWEPLLAAVSDLGHRAVAWDAPGFGRARRADRLSHRPSTRTRPSSAARSTPSRIDRAHLVAARLRRPVGPALGGRAPDRFTSAVLLGTGVLPGYRWHALARVWRTPLLGELFMATTTRAGFRLLLRRGNPRALPRAFVDRMYDDFDRHTRRAVLDLYRSVPDVAASRGAAGGRAAPARPARARALGPPRPLPARRARRAPARRLPARGDPRARAQRPLALRRRPSHRHRGADRLPRRLSQLSDCSGWAVLDAPWRQEARDIALIFGGVFLAFGIDLLVRAWDRRKRTKSSTTSAD